MNTGIVLTGIAFFAVSIAGLSAQETVLELDPSQTAIDFTLGATFHTVHGSFALKRGVIRYDLASGRASGEILVDATSGNTGNESRDRKMHKSVLESAKFPDIRFVPDRVTSGANGAVQVHGMLNIHGGSHELTLPVMAQTAGGKLTGTTKFVVPYVDWGMKNPSTLFLRVSDKVEVAVRAVGRLQ